MRERKTNDEEILRLLKEGKNQKQIAQHFGVSPVAIHKRLKRLTPPPETPNFNQLTDKEKRFVLEKVKGKSNIQAVMQSYDVTSRESAKAMGSQLMAKFEIQMSITELMEYCGIDRPYRIRRLKNIIDSPDLNIAHKGLDMSFRLDNSYPPQRNITLSAHMNLTPEQLRRVDEMFEELISRRISQMKPGENTDFDNAD